MAEPSSIPALVALFAPYCGGVGQEQKLLTAVQVLAAGSTRGNRSLSDGGGHDYVLSWRGEPAPLQELDCELRFPDFPAVAYDFRVPSRELVEWLMDTAGQGLPDSFWGWLLRAGRTAVAT